MQCTVLRILEEPTAVPLVKVCDKLFRLSVQGNLRLHLDMVGAPLLSRAEDQVRILITICEMRGEGKFMDDVAGGDGFDLADLDLGGLHGRVTELVLILPLYPHRLVVKHT